MMACLHLDSVAGKVGQVRPVQGRVEEGRLGQREEERGWAHRDGDMILLVQL